MTAHSPSASPARDEFQIGQIATITGGHTIHDAFSAFFPPLLPHIQTQLGLSYSQIGHVNAIMQIPFLLTLVLGWLADRFSIRYFVIFTPGITATLVVCLGILPSYPLLLATTLLLGLSVAAFHAPAPAMISNVSGRRVGLGMSLFMGSGELGRTIGPLVAAVGVAWIGVQGLWQLCVVGWLTTAVLYWRLHMVGAKSQQRATPHSLRVFVAQAAPMMALLTLMVVGRTFLQTAFTTYLPLYMRDVRGLTTFTEGAVTLSILEGAGVLGALLAGYLADHVPRRAILLTAFCCSTPLAWFFTQIPTEYIYWILPAVGFFSLSTTPVIFTIVLTRFPRNRALASASFMSMGVGSRALANWVMGLVADAHGLEAVYTVCVAIAAIAIIPLLFMRREDLEHG